jgi:hypothetical protein
MDYDSCQAGIYPKLIGHRRWAMGGVAYGINQNPEHNVEIIVHVDEAIGESKRDDLIDVLEGIDGVSSAEFCPLRYHLMLVNYNRDILDSQEVLVGVVSQNVHAELIGPV